jgi:hypothetical protein
VAICADCVDPCAEVHHERPIPLTFNPCGEGDRKLSNRLETLMKIIKIDMISTKYAPLILKMNLRPLRFGVDIEIFTEVETFIMCEVYPASNINIKASDIIYTKNTAFTKSLKALISITGKTPSTGYKVYCATRSIENSEIVSNDMEILNSAKTFTTLCCIPIYVNLLKSKIQTGEIPAKNFLNIY